MTENVKVEQETVRIKQVGAGVFCSPDLGNRQVPRNHIVRVPKDVAERLLSLEWTDTNNNVFPYFVLPGQKMNVIRFAGRVEEEIEEEVEEIEEDGKRRIVPSGAQQAGIVSGKRVRRQQTGA